MFHLSRLRITRPYRTSVVLEEERLWVDLYRRVANPAIAAEVIQHLDADADQSRPLQPAGHPFSVGRAGDVAIERRQALARGPLA